MCRLLYTMLILELRCLIGSKSTYLENKLPLWTWDCKNQKCVPRRPTSPKDVQSLTTCNMLCASLHLWPQPTGTVSLSTTAVPVRADLFQLQDVTASSKSVHEHIMDAFQLFREDLHVMEREVKGFAEWRAVNLYIVVNGSSDPRMRMDTDERYSLQLRPGSGLDVRADILALSFCGAIHALHTLLQLVWVDPYVGSLLTVEAARVEDVPKFRYRGLMIDTASNYYPISDLLRTIDVMASCKLNTFHWHISDSQSFPLQLATAPLLLQYGAFGPGAVYTTDDVRKLVRRARLRGIRVLIEVDTPAHVGRAWTFGPQLDLGELVFCVDAEPWTVYCSEPPCGQLNPRNQHVYEVIGAIYKEIIQITGVSDIFHLGGDQISIRCWEEHFNSTDPMDLWLEFTRSTLQQLQIVNGKMPNLTLLWTSHLTDHIRTGFKEFVHTLGLQARSAEWVQKYVKGIRTIASHEDAWDLNSGMGAWFEDTGGAPFNSWQRVYEHRPWTRGWSGYMEGGEATVWSATLSPGGLDTRLWPRAAALAERLWSDRPEGATRPVHARLDVYRSHLVSRGIQVTPLWSMWCTHNTYTCA